MNKANLKYDENYWLTVLLYFASFLIGLGIIAMIAANWQQIPNNFKLGGAIAAMVINALLLVLCMQRQWNVLRQVVACVYAFLIMGVIGLISQVYQLRPDVMAGCLAWSLLSWPLFLVAPRLLWLWIPLFFYGMHYLPPYYQEMIGGGVFGDSESWRAFVPVENDIFAQLRSVCVFGMLAAYELWMIYGKAENKTITRPLRFYAGFMTLCMYSNLAIIATHTGRFSNAMHSDWVLHAALLMPYLLLGLAFYGLNKWKKRSSFMACFVWGAIFEYLYVLTWMLWNHVSAVGLLGNFSSIHVPVDSWLPVVFCLLMVIYANKQKMKRLRNVAFACLIIWFFLTFDDKIFDIIPSLVICATLAVLAYQSNNRKWFNAAVILAVLRILIYYGDVQNLQYLGIYLIGSGMLIIATILGLMKYGRRLWENNNEK